MREVFPLVIQCVSASVGTGTSVVKSSACSLTL